MSKQLKFGANNDVTIIQLAWLVAEWISWQNGWRDRDAPWQKNYKTANFLSIIFFLHRAVWVPIGARALRLQPHQPHGWSGHGQKMLTLHACAIC